MWTNWLAMAPLWRRCSSLPHGTMTVPGRMAPPTLHCTPQPHRPAATVRCGIPADGRLIDLRLIARPWRDDVALAAAPRLEQDLGGWRPRGGPTDSRVMPIHPPGHERLP